VLGLAAALGVEVPGMAGVGRSSNAAGAT
jgi:hypothetical protein